MHKILQRVNAPLKPDPCWRDKSRLRNLQAPGNSLCSEVAHGPFSQSPPQSRYSLHRADGQEHHPPHCTRARQGAGRCAEALRRATAAAGWSSRSPLSPLGLHRPPAASPGWRAVPGGLCMTKNKHLSTFHNKLT